MDCLSLWHSFTNWKVVYMKKWLTLWKIVTLYFLSRLFQSKQKQSQTVHSQKMASVQPKNSGGPITKFWEAPETISALEIVKTWLCKHAKKVRILFFIQFLSDYQWRRFSTEGRKLFQRKRMIFFVHNTCLLLFP